MNQNYQNYEGHYCSGIYESYAYPEPNLRPCQYQIASANSCQESSAGTGNYDQDQDYYSTGEGGESLEQNGFSINDGEMICYRCESIVEPEMDKYPTAGTHAFVVLFAVLGMALLMFVPYMFNWFGKPVQRCPNCGAFLTEPSTKPLKDPVPLH